ncbi:hypothetical protein J5U18_12740 [Sphingobacteriaceae bacterium WQ 2009]|uniref:Uncharacterized protein n=1 Tax=Rhinopithecimicrobium faecis TaxID=2820698 RepID=A0A8T4HGE9_9SPHI|nr:hypothetical protein [Sphingobacteriaceae bacterium WQ 2009]
MNKVEKITENTAAIKLPDSSVYTISLNTHEDVLEGSNHLYNNNWESDPSFVLGKKIVPYGMNNDLPIAIRDIMDKNNLAPGIIERQVGLLYGEGPQLYQVVFEHGEVRRNYVDDKEISTWLKTWEVRSFLEKALVEYKHLKGFFARRYRSKATRIAAGAKIAKLEVVPASQARLGWPESDFKRLEDVKFIYTGDFSYGCYRTGINTFPVYSNADPFKHAVSMSYHNSYSFARSFYPVPSYFGTLPWLTRSSEIPEIIKYLTENGIAAAFHIHSPQNYWKSKRDKLEERYPEKDPEFIDARLDELKDKLFNDISLALAGKKNAGKFIETVDFYDPEADQMCSWKIEPIDQKIKDFIDAQIKIGEKADSAATSGMGLHPSLANIILNSSLSSGSTMLYALKLYFAADTTIPEEVIFEPINQAIAANWPDKNLKLGFYRKVVMNESSVSPDNRVTNQV